ncbi:caspase-7-like [Anopheles ziemanni]|uniref:caspase-7-like n=1 Tax=Anopheles coustani TaxID=139045 RepID=UPI0026597619|nr:caspase-7-like [Anopheles coustani]XP_058170747.1 caspase-7-like [Anopheles ziemanni]
MESPGENDLCYKTSHRSRGKALVINYTVNRDGSEKDTQDVEKVLKSLQFDVRVEHDLKEMELLLLLKEVANEDHTDSDCFVMVVMAHGGKEKIMVEGFDFAVDRLWQNFVGNRCPGLIGKPKLFFIQSCRGSLQEKDQDGVIQKDAAPVACNEENFVLPMHADLLVMYASYYEYVAYRNKDDGSWFIQALCNVLSRDIRQTELLSLLTDVSYQVVFKYSMRSGPEGKRMLQIPMITSMLTKKFYFVEKDVPAVKESICLCV